MNSIEKILKQKDVLEFISSAKPKYKRNIIKHRFLMPGNLFTI